MRAHGFLALLALAAAGCSTSPQPILNGGAKHEFAMAGSSRAVAECVAWNARNFNAGYSAPIAELTRPDSFQVIVGQNYELFYPIIVARTAPAEKGSQLVLHVSDRLDPPEVSDWLERLRKGC